MLFERHMIIVQKHEIHDTQLINLQNKRPKFDSKSRFLIKKTECIVAARHQLAVTLLRFSVYKGKKTFTRNKYQ